MSFPVPAGWEWVNDWSVDHRGDVDADGWAYAVSFRSREFSGVCTQAHYVCRRVWVRLRRRIPDANIDPAQASALADSALILSIPTLVRACTLDRQKLDAVQSALTQLASPKDSVVIPPYSVEAILNELEFDKSKLAAVKILLPMLDREGLVAALFQIGFHSNRLELLTEVEPDSFLHAHLTVT
ncbi:hypothetical protein BC830DRAFT_828524 [Chytriomyces sp. MP71]|nr:hypothetical protein BC830DRAFT_828524 [Chytriomyces sp. MP71]